MTAAVSTRAEIAAALDRLVAAPAPLLVVADFDGTLAAGSRDPAAARIEPGAQRALRRLAGIGGRAAGSAPRRDPDRPDRARRRGPGPGRRHRVPRGPRAPVGDAPPGRPARRRSTSPSSRGSTASGSPAEALAAGVVDVLGRPPWLFVERKGPSVAFHVRQADDVPAARAAVLAAIATVEAGAGLGDHGLTPYRGRSVVDLRPRDAGGKREAIERLSARERPGRRSRSATT